MFETVFLAPWNFMLGFSWRKKRVELFLGFFALCYDRGETKEDIT